MTNIKPRLRIALVVATVVLLAACGSTVTGSAMQGDQATSGLGGSSAGGATSGLGGSSAGGATSGLGGSSAGGATTSVDTTAAGGQAATSASGSGAGVPADGTSAGSPKASGASGAGSRSGQPIEIGAYIAKNAAAVGAAFGVSGYSSFDQEAHFRELAADLNRRGGLAGHPIRMVFASLDATSSETYASQEQASCATFTADNHVNAVLEGFITMVAGLPDCLTKRHIPLIMSTEHSRDRTYFVGTPPLRVALAQPLWDRAVPTLIDSLVRRGELTAPNKVGVLAYDTPAGHRHVEQIFRPALAAHGLRLTDPAYLHYPASTQDAGATLSELPNVVLKWKTEGIDLLLEDAPVASYFEKVAANQDYHPHYGLTTPDRPFAMNGTKERVSGIGWIPFTDTGQDAPHNAGFERCRRLTGSSGGTNWASDAPGRATALMDCDVFAVLETAVARSRAADPAGIAAGLPNVGTAVQSGLTFALRLDATHPDAVVGYREFSYATGCSCIGYVSPIRGFR